MDKARIYCEDCDEWFIVEFNYVSELPETRCPKCNENNIWFGDIECDRSQPIIMGRGGCRQK